MRQYEPFAYPPNYKIAKIHQQATMPGKINPQTSIKCPCCSLPTKQPLNNWLSRSIDQDFKNKGGAVVTYFWLVKLYSFMSLMVLIIYSSYLIGSIHRICGIAQTDVTVQTKCQKFLGIWIITNQSLFEVMQILKQNQAITRIYTLRTITYVLLLIGNLMALYTSGRFKRRYPQPKDISNFSLIFKNVHKSTEQFTLQLQQKFNNPAIKQIFNIKTMQPFYTLYNQKFQIYYQSKIQENESKKNKLLKTLQTLDRKCSKYQVDYQVNSDRVIVIFNEEATRNKIKQAYQLKGIEKIKYIIGISGSKQQYCQPCPIPEEIIWNNIGSNQSHKIKLKILSVVYFFLLIGGSYFLLAFCMRLAYDRNILPSPWNVIVANIIMTLMVPLALTFRQLMNKLSEMRRPNTLTNRTMFIVITTVLFHFIYYILIPTFYLKFSQIVEKNKVLFIITNQTFNFLIVQFILAKVDFIFCQWNRRLKKIQDQQKPIGCQKILNNQIQYPRFPIQFKLIILFKTFSFIILFAFESPLIMFLCFVLVLFLYYTDKLSVYKHYRMQIIGNGVQYKFLKIYSIFFSVYTFLIYSLTQHFEDLSIQFYSAFILMIIAVLIQIFVLKDRIFEDQTILPQTLQQLQLTDSYKKRFEQFRQYVVNDQIDNQISEYLAKTGYNGSLKTEQTITGKEKLIKS